MVLCDPKLFVVILYDFFVNFGGSLWLFEVLGSSWWFLMALGGSWWFLVVLGGF